MRHATASPSLLSPVLIAGSLILMIGFSIRASFGVFQIPIANEFGWARAEFSLAIALQNLAWGFGQPIFGTISERLGNRAAVLLGGALYALGLVLSAFAITPGQHQLLEIIVGFGVAGTGFGVILGVVGRATPEKHRSMAMGIATAAGSAGQVFGAPVAEIMLGYLAWQSVFLIFAGVILLAMFAVPLLNAPDAEGPSEPAEPLGRVLSRALKDPSYILIFVGFFSCGYQLAFITAHFPAMVTEMCGAIAPNGMLAALGITTTSVLGAVSISVIGLANIAGTITAGWLGARYSRKNLLAGIYVLRTLAAAAFILMPITPVTVLLFSVVMGALWLATVPLTAGLVAHIWGMRYMATLYGIVFLSHQIGGFMGVWLGGKMYDLTGDYTLVWWIGIGVGAFSAIVHLPVRENRAPAAVAAA
ncbi:MFS transporter [Falsigemmobacter intermedius]|uniref:MFS transporter n=1 Tax=Falsigemmobacter intermedius TaxID=1553448 RepID=A0A444MA09_9RHOB|nr:MFS transporter [Falsigemmobacter intermedius]RWY40016.1 MFS transporter [Falsigemmobacter intermedius]